MVCLVVTTFLLMVQFCIAHLIRNSKEETKNQLEKIHEKIIETGINEATGKLD